jgi:Flp pilus assembly protein TadD
MNHHAQRIQPIFLAGCSKITIPTLWSRACLVAWVTLASVSCIALPANASSSLAAKNLKITLPRHSELTPVQRLNREGVNAILKHRYENAEGLFYKAYLYDPADPFTLNNLGYVAELQGQIDRAEKFYKLAAEQSCAATIDRSTAKELEGKPMVDALGTLKDVPMRINRLNVVGMELLAQDRGFEAEAHLKEALALDPKNVFTLNNLGVAQEATGDLESALTYYDAAAAARSNAPVGVTRNLAWRGKPVSEMAADSARNLRKRMQKMNLSQVRAAMFAIRGVSAINENNWSAAKQDFLDAYILDPQSAFALNNLGYVAEREGDFETAKAYYARARKGDNADARVGLATQSAAQGQHLVTVADDNHRDMDIQLDAHTQDHSGQKNSFELKRRSNQTVPPETSPNNQSSVTLPAVSSSQLPPQ